MRPRFSLRTLFVVMTLIAALFGWRSFNLARAQELADLIVAGDYRSAEQQVARAPWIAEALASLDDNNQVAPEVSANVVSSGVWSYWWFPSLRVTIRSSVDGETVTVGPMRSLPDQSNYIKGKSVNFLIAQSFFGF